MRLVVHLESHDDAQERFHLAAGADDVLVGERDDTAEWTIDVKPGEFWWPRAESLKDVLAPIPPRYTIVQALVREFDADARCRRSVEQMKAAGRTLLRPAHRRGYPDRTVPLRAWYPLEVLTVAGADDASLEDRRLGDALDGVPTFRTPDIVEDAAFAVDCAEVGEVDLPKLEAYVAELEQRVALLEQRFWPRVQRAAAGVIRRR